MKFDVVLTLESFDDRAVQLSILSVQRPILLRNFLRAILHRFQTVVLRFGIFALPFFVLDER